MNTRMSSFFGDSGALIDAADRRKGGAERANAPYYDRLRTLRIDKHGRVITPNVIQFKFHDEDKPLKGLGPCASSLLPTAEAVGYRYPV
jgi:hypothetical protein